MLSSKYHGTREVQKHIQALVSVPGTSDRGTFIELYVGLTSQTRLTDINEKKN